MPPFPLRTKVELGFGADLTAHPRTWPREDVSSRLRTERSVSVKRGRANESAQAQPASWSGRLSNADGWLTPGKATSPYYPHVVRNVPMWFAVHAGQPRLWLPGTAGARARTPDHASLDVTDLWAGIEMLLPAWRPPQSSAWDVLGRWTAGQRSWLLYLDYGAHVSGLGAAGLRWSTNGSNLLEELSTLPPTPPISGRWALAVHLDVNNGAGGHTIRFYQGDRLADIVADPASHLLGDPIVNSGTTSIFGGSSPLDIGDVDGSTLDPVQGYVIEAQVRNGDHTGTVVVDPDFTAQALGAASFADTVPKTWTVTAPAEINDVKPRFAGIVPSWEPDWPHGRVEGLAVIDVTAAGAMRRINRRDKPLQSAIHRRATGRDIFAGLVIGEDAVDAYWPCEDGRDARVASSGFDHRTMSIGGDVRFAADDTLPGSDALPTVAGGKPFGWNAPVPPRGPADRWGVDIYVSIPTPDTASTPILLVGSEGTVRTWLISFSDTLRALAGYNVDGTGLFLDTGGIGDFFGGWTHVRLEADQNGGNIDWRLQWVPLFGPTAGVAFTETGSQAGTLGRVTDLRNLGTAPPDGISFGHLIVSHDTDVSWLANADRGWMADTVVQRVVRLGIEEGTDVRWQVDPADPIAGFTKTTSDQLGEQRTLSLPQLLQEGAKADMGLLGDMWHSPGVAYRARSSLYNQTPKLIIDAAAHGPTGGLALPFGGVLDDQRLANWVTVKRDGGSSGAATTNPPPAPDELYDTAVTLNVAYDAQLRPQAGWRLHLGTWDQLRHPTVKLKLAKATDLIDDFLELTEGDLIRIINLPAEYPTPTVDLLVEQIAETIGSMQWDVTLACSPAGPWTVGLLDDEVLGRLDTTASELVVGVDDNDASWTVATTEGPVWVDSVNDPAEFPFDLMVAGERVTVTAISGTTSPQTFTVTRSVNGVAKSHPAGAAVELADPLVLAL